MPPKKANARKPRKAASKPRKAASKPRKSSLPTQGCTLSSLGYQATMSDDQLKNLALRRGMRVFPASELSSLPVVESPPRLAIMPPTSPTPPTSGVDVSDAIIIKPTSTGTFELMKPAAKKRLTKKRVTTARKKVSAKKKRAEKSKKQVSKNPPKYSSKQWPRVKKVPLAATRAWRSSVPGAVNLGSDVHKAFLPAFFGSHDYDTGSKIWKNRDKRLPWLHWDSTRNQRTADEYEAAPPQVYEYMRAIALDNMLTD